MHVHLLCLFARSFSISVIYVVHLFFLHPYNNIIFTFMFLRRVDITGVSEDQDTAISEDRKLSHQDGNYAPISVSIQDISPNFASFEGNPFPDPIERCVYNILVNSQLRLLHLKPHWFHVSWCLRKSVDSA